MKRIVSVVEGFFHGLYSGMVAGFFWGIGTGNLKQCILLGLALGVLFGVFLGVSNRLLEDEKFTARGIVIRLILLACHPFVIAIFAVLIGGLPALFISWFFEGNDFYCGAFFIFIGYTSFLVEYAGVVWGHDGAKGGESFIGACVGMLIGAFVGGLLWYTFGMGPNAGRWVFVSAGTGLVIVWFLIEMFTKNYPRAVQTCAMICLLIMTLVTFVTVVVAFIQNQTYMDKIDRGWEGRCAALMQEVEGARKSSDTDPRIRGKIVIIDRKVQAADEKVAVSAELSDVTRRIIPIGMLARNPEQAQSIVFLDWREEKVGRYNVTRSGYTSVRTLGQVDGYRSVCDISLLDRSTHTLYYLGSVTGDDPPEGRVSGVSATDVQLHDIGGGRPYDDVVRRLREQFSFKE